MVAYTKPWLSVDEQIDHLVEHGIHVGNRQNAAMVLSAIGYYRLTGYLYPFRESEQSTDAEGRPRVRVLDRYQPQTTLRRAEEITDFDRRLRMLVMDGIERIEVALRMQIGYVLGRVDPFAYEDPDCFIETFTAPTKTESGEPDLSKHAKWLARVYARKASSDEPFVKHFRDKYDDRMPVWALTEILELGQLSVLYRGMRQPEAEEIAAAFGVPTKRLMASWLASLNYVRNVAAHHARLFNRKLQNAPARPKVGQIPALDHLRDTDTAKATFGTYNALAVIAHLVRAIDPDTRWPAELASLLREFPTSPVLTIESMGAPPRWQELSLWPRIVQSEDAGAGPPIVRVPRKWLRCKWFTR